MDEKARQNALEKVASMSSEIAYPNELVDDNKLEEFYKGLELSSDNYLGNILSLTLFDTDDAFTKLRKPVNKTDWVSRKMPAVVNAFYATMDNIISKLFYILILKAMLSLMKKSKNTFFQ